MLLLLFSGATSLLSLLSPISRSAIMISFRVGFVFLFFVVLILIHIIPRVARIVIIAMVTRMGT